MEDTHHQPLRDMVEHMFRYSRLDRDHNLHRYHNRRVGSTEHLVQYLDHNTLNHLRNSLRRRTHIVVRSLVCSILRHSKHPSDHHPDSYSFDPAHREVRHNRERLVVREVRSVQQQRSLLQDHTQEFHPDRQTLRNIFSPLLRSPLRSDYPLGFSEADP